ncbi:MAG TPA: acyl-CoA dehydrogenase family protein [Candidatus Limnocylindrales bacterium]|nr:acyl-CoA dehydrogenase family protein [Candidatus Limnocylindrales bacterium]
MAQPRDFGFGQDEQMVRDQARRFLKDNLPVDKLRALVARDHHEAYESATQPVYWDQKLWASATELGWTGLGVPAEAGGAGMGLVAVAALAEEAGRAALPSPLVSTFCTAEVLKAASAAAGPDGAAAAGALARIASGSAASLAISGDSPAWDVSETAVRAQDRSGGVMLSGTSYFVQDARKAGFFLIAARGDETVLAVVDADAPGVTIDPDRIVDLTRDQASVVFSNVEVPAQAVVARGAQADAALRRAEPALLTIVAADLCGGAEWLLQTTAEYARTRKQFDRPIGFFQAVKHPIVNMMVEIDRARSLVYAAASAIDHEPENGERLARMAKAAASDAAAFVAGRAIQLHGGIGFTWECDVHIWVKRLQHNQFLYGDGSHHRARLAEIFDA